eukprot:5867009-Prymnesium_polylepis.1
MPAPRCGPNLCLSDSHAGSSQRNLYLSRMALGVHAQSSQHPRPSLRRPAMGCSRFVCPLLGRGVST